MTATSSLLLPIPAIIVAPSPAPKLPPSFSPAGDAHRARERARRVRDPGGQETSLPASAAAASSHCIAAGWSDKQLT